MNLSFSDHLCTFKIMFKASSTNYLENLRLCWHCYSTVSWKKKKIQVRGSPRTQLDLLVSYDRGFLLHGLFSIIDQLTWNKQSPLNSPTRIHGFWWWGAWMLTLFINSKIRLGTELRSKIIGHLGKMAFRVHCQPGQTWVSVQMLLSIILSVLSLSSPSAEDVPMSSIVFPTELPFSSIESLLSLFK